MKLCDRVVLSCDGNPLYTEFWPWVEYAYRTIFPETEITLALVSDDQKLFERMNRHDNVLQLSPAPGFSAIAQSKMARYYVASLYEYEVCMIDDLDEIPIDRRWHVRKTATRKPGTMLFIGTELYSDGKAPASMMTGEGTLYRRLLGPSLYSVSWPEFLSSLREVPLHHEHQNMVEGYFSDESLVASCSQERMIPRTDTVRGYQVGHDTIDRSYVSSFSFDRLTNDGYLMSHAPRPFSQFNEINLATMQYIRNRYQGGPLPEPLAF